MADPFLLAHEVSPFYFDIGGRLSPISIRDQMVRAHVIVDRMAAVRLIGPTRPLLVVGAGAAGVTAAMHAVGRHRVATTLIERGAVPFGIQLGCRSRWVDPLQYDWPADHCDRGRYPWSPPPAVPLPWAGDQPYLLALGWTTRFRRFLRSNRALLRYWRRTTTAGLPVRLPNHTLQISFNPITRPTGVFGAALSCIGFGLETTRAHPASGFSGFAFWNTDPYDQPSLGMPSPGATPRVLISGAGDGALQDFLRIVLDPTSPTRPVIAKEVIHALPLPTTVTDRLYSEEDRALREYAWSGSGTEDHVVHQALHDVHQSVVSTTLLTAAVGKAVDRMLRKPLPNVQLAFPCTHFGHCYALNRFLVLLVATRLADTHGVTMLQPRTAVTEVYCKHAPPASPLTCHGQPHDADLSFCPNCSPVVSMSPKRHGPFDAVIIRHGVQPPAPVIGLPLRHPRQIPAYRVVV